MISASLAGTALFMGLVGGPHCIAMCGAACAALGQGATAGQLRASPMWLFQVGRMIGYAVVGALAAASLQGIGWLTTQSAALRPVWSFFHVACIALGLVLAWRGQQPLWLDAFGRRLWMRARAWGQGRSLLAPLLLGSAWALLPCGLLYSALMLASLAGEPLGGACVMALFAVGTSVSLMAGPWLWLRLRATAQRWGMRTAGLALAASSSWALWMGLVHNTAPWCATP